MTTQIFYDLGAEEKVTLPDEYRQITVTIKNAYQFFNLPSDVRLTTEEGNHSGLVYAKIDDTGKHYTGVRTPANIIFYDTFYRLTKQKQFYLALPILNKKGDDLVMKFWIPYNYEDYLLEDFKLSRINFAFFLNKPLKVVTKSPCYVSFGNKIKTKMRIWSGSYRGLNSISLETHSISENPNTKLVEDVNGNNFTFKQIGDKNILIEMI